MSREKIIDVMGRGVIAPQCVAERRDEGFRIVLSVHDELITEIHDDPDYTAEVLARIMTRPWHWAPGLPLAAAGFEAKRYRKE